MTKRDQAAICGVNYSTFARWCKGMEVSQVILDKIEDGYKRLR